MAQARSNTNSEQAVAYLECPVCRTRADLGKTHCDVCAMELGEENIKRHAYRSPRTLFGLATLLGARQESLRVAQQAMV